MSSPRPLPSKIGIGTTGRAHLAFADNTQYCDESRSLVGKITSQPGAGFNETIAALLAMDIPPRLVCRRCLPLPQFHDSYAKAWGARAPIAQAPGPIAKPAPHVTVVNGGHAARIPAKPNDTLTVQIDGHDVIGIDLAGGSIGQWDAAGQWSRVATLPGHTTPDGADAPSPAFAADTVALRTQNERLTARCAELTAETQQARAAANDAEAMHDAQAASLAQLAEMAEQLRCLNADWHNDVILFGDTGHKRDDGLRYTTGRITELATALSAAARGYTRPKPTDLHFPDLPALLAEHGWTETPARELAMHEDTRPMPMLQAERNPAWLRVWRRGTDHIAAWFTSPRSLDWLSCNTRGRLAELREIDHVITSKDAGRREPAAPPKPDPAHGPTIDTTIDQVAAIMTRHGWQQGVWAPRHRPGTGRQSCVWTKRGHGLDEHGRPRQVQIYGTGRPGTPAVVWYWAGRITAAPQLWRIAER